MPVIILYVLFFYSGYLPVLSDSISFDAKTYELNRIKLKKCDIMVIGSSIALNDINTRLFKDNFQLSYYNFAAWDLQVQDDYFLLKHYVLKYHPKYVVFPATMYDFTTEPDTSLPSNLDLEGQFLGYYYIKNFANIREIIKQKKALDLSAKDNNRYDCLRFDEGGGVSLQMTKEALSPVRMKEHLDAFPTRYTPHAYTSLSNIAAFLKKNNVKMIFLQTPYSNSYIQSQQLKNNVKAHLINCKAIVENRGGVFLNYDNLFMNNENGMFVDPIHLSLQGSMVLTRRLVQDLKIVIH